MIKYIILIINYDNKAFFKYFILSNNYFIFFIFFILNFIKIDLKKISNL